MKPLLTVPAVTSARILLRLLQSEEQKLRAAASDAPDGAERVEMVALAETVAEGCLALISAIPPEQLPGASQPPRTRGMRSTRTTRSP